MSTDIPVKWTTRSSVVTLCPSAAGLINLAAGNHALGAENDFSAGDTLMDVQLKCRGADVFHAGDYVSVWFLTAADGTNYEDGAAGTPGTTPARAPDLIFPVRAVNTQQIITLTHVPTPNAKSKALVQNTTNHNFTNTADENVLTAYTYSDKLVQP